VSSPKFLESTSRLVMGFNDVLQTQLTIRPDEGILKILSTLERVGQDQDDAHLEWIFLRISERP
jgi:hypothetical protein